ncbi:MAG: type II toxin-antitoxin system VapC family toxin [Chloroflexota bacterium]|nr:type II toxin-antitoxin system VapC family toxin [Chloroflexota bacterium]
MGRRFSPRKSQAVDLLADLQQGGIAISVITYMELAEGIATGRSSHQQQRGFRGFLRGTRVLVIGRSTAERTADIRMHLRQQKRPVKHRVLDRLVAATAIQHRLILVTRNTRDYADITGLRLYQRL